jgi:ATP-binding cassette, subfamily B, multidrug efflux pump
MVGKTVIAIAHRLSTVMDMDRLIVLQRGMIVADGAHSELLRRGGLYAELWHRQSGGFNPVASREEDELEEELPAEGAGAGDLVVERQHALAGHEDRS